MDSIVQHPTEELCLCCRGVSEEAIAASDIRCSIPMAGMVDSFNVSVAAGILMHHAAHDRIIRAVRATPYYSSLSWSNIVNFGDCCTLKNVSGLLC